MPFRAPKLDHRIIVFTGGIACGKTTIKQDKGDLVKAVEYYKAHAEAIDYMGLTHE